MIKSVFGKLIVPVGLFLSLVASSGCNSTTTTINPTPSPSPSPSPTPLPTPTISLTGSSFAFTTGNAVSITPTVTNASSVSIAPALTNGLILNDITGAITGTAAGTLSATTYTLTATNVDGQFTQVTATFSLTIYAAPTISVSGSPFAYYTTGNSVSITPTVTNAASVSISPALSNGLSFNTATGAISGTANGTLPTTSYTLTASNQLGTQATWSLYITIYAMPTISISGSPFAYTTGNIVSIIPSLTNATSVSISSALGNGLSLNDVTGAVTGTATGTLSVTTYTLTASNQLGSTATATLSIAIYAAPMISVSGSPFAYTAGNTVSISPSVANATSVSISPTLSNGLSLNTVTGAITGTANGTLNTSPYTLTAKNGAGQSTQVTFSLTIYAAPTISILGSPFTYTSGSSVSIAPTVTSATSVSISPALSNGLSLNTATGAITGTATGTLPTTNYTLTASNQVGSTATATLSIAVTATVTPSGADVTINPSTVQTVNFGQAQTFTVTATNVYPLSSTVGGTCPAGSWNGAIYSTGVITTNCTVIFSASINWASVAVGGSNTCALSNNKLYCWGANEGGQLGSPATNTASSTPTLIAGLPTGTIQGYALGSGGQGGTVCALVAGNVWCWGNGSNGQLGNGLGTDSSVPVQVTAPWTGTITSIAVGWAQACALTSLGEVWCWGYILSYVSTNSLVPIRVNLPANAVSIAVDGQRTTALLADGSLWLWAGDALYNDANSPAQIPAPSGNPIISSLTAGCILTSTNAVECWQSDSAGNWTTYSGFNGPVASLSGKDGNQACALLSDGTVECFGSGDSLGEVATTALSPNLVPGLGDVTQLAASNDHSCALVGNSLYCWGKNGFGELGNGNTANSVTPTLVLSPGDTAGGGSTGGGGSPTIIIHNGYFGYFYNNGWCDWTNNYCGTGLSYGIGDNGCYYNGNYCTG